MKAIILAAGEGQRMRPLTLTVPKSLLKIKGRPVLDYVFDALPPEIDEVIVVVRHLGEQIKNYLGENYRGRKIAFVEGSDKGTAYSFLATKPVIGKEEFLVLYGDEFPNPEDVCNCLAAGLSVITFESNNPKLHGMASLRPDGTLEAVVEKPEIFESRTAVGGLMVLNDAIFKYQPYPNQKREYYLTSLLNQFVKEHRVVCIPSKNFIGDITAPQDLDRVENLIDRN